MGGIQVSMTPDKALSFCETIVISEGEDVWPRVLKDFEEGCLRRIHTSQEVLLWNTRNAEMICSDFRYNKKPRCLSDCL
jgi:hypothetical protein